MFLHRVLWSQTLPPAFIAQGTVVTDFATSFKVQAQQGLSEELVTIKYSPQTLAKVELRKVADKGLTEDQLQGLDFSIYWDFVGHSEPCISPIVSFCTPLPL